MDVLKGYVKHVQTIFILEQHEFQIIQVNSDQLFSDFLLIENE